MSDQKPGVAPLAAPGSATQESETMRCSVCDQLVPDPNDLVCADCYEGSRAPLPDPVTLTLSRSDAHTILGYLVSKKTLVDLRIRFFNALELAAKPVGAPGTGEPRQVEPHVQAVVDRAADWCSRLFDDEIKGCSPTRFETEALTIIKELLICIDHPGVGDPPPASPPPAELRGFDLTVPTSPMTDAEKSVDLVQPITDQTRDKSRSRRGPAPRRAARPGTAVAAAKRADAGVSRIRQL